MTLQQQAGALPVPAIAPGPGELPPARGVRFSRAPRRRQVWRTGLALFLTKRILLIPVSILLVIIISFLLIALIPQSTAMTIAGDDASPERIAQIQSLLGLDKPLWQQFFDYLGRLVQGNLGTSFYTQLPVGPEILKKVPASLELAAPAFIISFLLGTGTGTLAAFFQGRLPDKWERITSTILYATPEFLIGVGAIYVFFFLLGWVPAPTGRVAVTDPLPPGVTGMVTIDSALAGQWGTFGHALQRLVLPVLVLGVAGSVTFARMTRAALSEALHSQYIDFARAQGLPRRQVVRYALTDVRTSLLLYVALGVGGLIGGSAIIETLFSWPGIGAFGVSGLANLDPPIIQAFVLLTGTTTLVTFVVLDLISMLLDPRVSLDNGH